MTPQRRAALWHWWDAAWISVAWIGAVVGLIGHYKLRQSYAEWHEANREVANR